LPSINKTQAPPSSDDRKQNLHIYFKNKNLEMYQDGCYGCSQSFLWSGYRTSSYPRKPASFHIMDILHIRPDHQVPSALGPFTILLHTFIYLFIYLFIY
jgi:hypothetical protein